MRPLLFLGFAVAVTAAFAAPASAASSTPAPTPPHRPAVAQRAQLADLAPADRYFGPFGMSPLSIRSTIGLLGREYHYRTISDHDLLRKALITEDALRKWRASYPADPWLAPTFFHLEQLYATVQSDEARKHATAILNDIVRKYPNTKEGHLSRSRLAAGFPPLVPESALVASPAPSADPSAAPASQATLPSPAATPSAPSSPSAGNMRDR